jgi:hypothetical protein
VLSRKRQEPIAYNHSMPGDFPTDDSLCEACGYPLKGIEYNAQCPECGELVASSDPAITRPGLPIQHRFTPATVFHAYRTIALSPKAAFRRVRLHGGLANERLFLLLNCVITALLFEAVRLTGWCAAPVYTGALIVPISLSMLAMEAWGVQHFALRRQWRVDFRLALRVVCLSSVGWLPLGPLAAFAVGAYQNGWISQNLVRFIERVLPYPEFYMGVIAYTIAILWFETIVGLGVRKVRYGNRILEYPPAGLAPS